MDEALAAIVKVLTGLGLPGVIICGLAFVIYWLLQQWQSAQEARIQEGKEAVKAITAQNDALRNLTEVLKARNNA